MKKFFLIFLFFTGNTKTIRAQGFFGFRFSPGISINTKHHTKALPDKVKVFNVKNSTRMGITGYYDYPLREDRCYFVSGLSYTNFRIKILYRLSTSEEEKMETHRLGYFTIPLLIKPCTDEIWLDTSFFFKGGFLLGARVEHFQQRDQTEALIEEFNIFNLGLLIGMGVRYAIGTSSNIMVGLSYVRNFFNTLEKSHKNKLAGVNLYHRSLSIDFGIRF